MTEPLEINFNPTRMFAIGDLHGCSEELAVLLTHLTEKEKITQKDLLIFIGDYVDRGPDSKGVIDQLLDLRNHFPSTVFLKGNHEDMLLSYLGYPGRMGMAYLSNGGEKTLQSYGFKRIRHGAEILESFPPVHLQFLLSLTPYMVYEHFAFAHAGLSPIKELNNQSEEDLYWIRDEFIHNIHRFDKTVVFGHTPFQEILLHPPFKIGIDTGLVYGNRLTCIEVIDKRIIQVKRGEKEVSTSSFLWSGF